ncbi:hypothetical protein [Desulfovibrio sp. JC010]|uniref:hypothetical protein n=1 Tax=Desulfovibrio sp. JC010 TaxID=2593641 RepID=UPI0013D2DF7E|nr:hypothetical protein [Desulfovibrio sp. JC010]NDV27722.1 hypothetical protein [Desulfovibrio sp. JC010]
MIKIKVSAVPERGFCRCGKRWPHEGAIVSREDFTDEQWAILQAEKMIKLEPVEDEPDKEEPEETATGLSAEEVKAIKDGIAGSESSEILEDETKKAFDASKERLAQLIDVFTQLGPDDMTQSGTPSVKAVEAALGADVTAAEIGEAWTFYQARLEEQTGKNNESGEAE